MIYDILILGAGWTSTFLIPLLEDERVKFAATSRTGRDSTIKWTFDPSMSKEDARKSFKVLPEAHHVLITFPLLGSSSASSLVEWYGTTHETRARYIQLGSTGIYQSIEQPDLWITRHSPYDAQNDRAQAEDALKRLGGVVLNLSGLWGGERQPRAFVDRLFKSKLDVQVKTSLHMVHGRDVARSILAVTRDWPGPSRWMLTDGFVYDWWALLAGWGSSTVKNRSAIPMEKDDSTRATSGDGDAGGEVLTWVRECMSEQGVRALPRSMEALGRCYDSREFWETFKLVPVRARI